MYRQRRMQEARERVRTLCDNDDAYAPAPAPAPGSAPDWEESVTRPVPRPASGGRVTVDTPCVRAGTGRSTDCGRACWTDRAVDRIGRPTDRRFLLYDGLVPRPEDADDDGLVGSAIGDTVDALGIARRLIERFVPVDDPPPRVADETEASREVAAVVVQVWNEWPRRPGPDVPLVRERPAPDPRADTTRGTRPRSSFSGSRVAALP